MKEFEVISMLRNILDMETGKDILIGNGDDAAILYSRSGKIAVTTDSMVEGVHFRFDLSSPQDIGYKLVAVNLSDLAAMGSKPKALLLSLCIPSRLRPSIIRKIAMGIREACEDYQSPVVGGNITSTQGPLVMSMTALGEPNLNGLLRRDKAKMGDDIYVSGALGLGYLGLCLLERKPRWQSLFPTLVRYYRRPNPRLDIGWALAEMGEDISAIDCSDGLLQDLGHVLSASGIGATIHVDRIPITEEANIFCKKIGIDPIQAALTGGDDYQIIALMKKELRRQAESLGLVWIGRCDRRKGIYLRKGTKKISSPQRKGYEHLSNMFFNHFG